MTGASRLLIFEEKLLDVVGLYVNPPERAAVFSFDEKTQVQALDRTQPSPPMRPGRARTMTHDYNRHGSVDVFAALNVATGEVLTDYHRTHSAADVLRLFKHIDATVNADCRSTWCWTISLHTRPRRSPRGLLTPAAPAGICTPRRRRARG